MGDPSARYTFRIAKAHTCPSMHPPSPPTHTRSMRVSRIFPKTFSPRMKSGGGRIASTVVRGSQQQTHTVLEFYPTKITSSSAASGRPLKRQRPIRENTHDDLRKCFTNNTTSKSAEKIKVTIQTNYLNTNAKTKFQKTIRNEAAYQMLRMLTKVWGSGNGENTTDTDKPTQIDTQKALHRKGRDNKLYTTKFTYSA